MREHAPTRVQLLQTLVADLREHSQVRIVDRLERTPEQIRWLFKKTAVWERDQSVSRILPPQGEHFGETLQIPERFSRVGAPIMRERHSKLDPEEMERAVAKFAVIPDERKVRAEDNQQLLAEITEADLLAAAKALEHRKAVDEDGLNNDFYRDLPEVLVPSVLT